MTPDGRPPFLRPNTTPCLDPPRSTIWRSGETGAPLGELTPATPACASARAEAPWRSAVPLRTGAGALDGHRPRPLRVCSLSFFAWRFSLRVLPGFLEATLRGDLSVMSAPFLSGSVLPHPVVWGV